jgi:hypothetical protein
MANPIPNLFKVPELKEKILFTLMVLLIYRVGAHITVPGIDFVALEAAFDQFGGTLLGVYDLFVGGALSRATVLALGIMPYISASIMFQLLAAVFPTIEKMQKEGEDGRKKLTQWTRYATIVLAFMQAYGYSVFLQSLNTPGAPPVVRTTGFFFLISTTLILTMGAVFVMWLGEQITERGIGNGMSLLIFFSIIQGFPGALATTWEQLTTGVISWFAVIVLGRDGGGGRRRGGHDHGVAKDTRADTAEGHGPRPRARGAEELHPAADQLRRRDAHHLRAVDHHPAGHDGDVQQHRLPADGVDVHAAGSSGCTTCCTRC